MDKPEIEKYFNTVIQLLISEYISKMEGFIQITDENIKNLNNERKFLIENIDSLKESFTKNK